MGLLDDMIGGAREALREVNVQHVLVDSQMQARDVYDAIQAEGASSAVVGRYAAARSTCGSSKKRPDAKLQMLRGQPGELRFRRGAMAPEFERAAFEAKPGSLLQPFKTQFGWHGAFASGSFKRSAPCLPCFIIDCSFVEFATELEHAFVRSQSCSSTRSDSMQSNGRSFPWLCRRYFTSDS